MQMEIQGLKVFSATLKLLIHTYCSVPNYTVYVEWEHQKTKTKTCTHGIQHKKCVSKCYNLLLIKRS